MLVFLCFSLIFPGVRLSSDAQFSDFLDGLGPAQLVGRQTLATPPMGQYPQNFLIQCIVSEIALFFALDNNGKASEACEAFVIYMLQNKVMG